MGGFHLYIRWSFLSFLPSFCLFFPWLVLIRSPGVPVHQSLSLTPGSFVSPFSRSFHATCPLRNPHHMSPYPGSCSAAPLGSEWKKTPPGLTLAAQCSTVMWRLKWPSSASLTHYRSICNVRNDHVIPPQKQGYTTK